MEAYRRSPPSSDFVTVAAKIAAPERNRCDHWLPIERLKDERCLQSACSIVVLLVGGAESDMEATNDAV